MFLCICGNSYERRFIKYTLHRHFVLSGNKGIRVISGQNLANLIIYFLENRESHRWSPEASSVDGDLCLMNYPSRRGIRLNLKQVGGREGSSGKLIQTTHCPPSSFLFFFPAAQLSRFFPLFSRRTTLRLHPLSFSWLGRRDPSKRKAFEVILLSYPADQNAERRGN